MWCGGCYGKFEHVNIVVQNSTLVARAEASHASRFFKCTWTVLFKEWKQYGSGATVMVGKKKEKCLCLILFFCVCRSLGCLWGVSEMDCSMLSLQLSNMGLHPQTPSVTKTGNIYAFLFLSFFFRFIWLSQLHNAASCNRSSMVLLGNSVSFIYWIENCHIGVDYLP